MRIFSRMAAISRSGIRPATGSVYAAPIGRLTGIVPGTARQLAEPAGRAGLVDAFQPALGVGRDLIDDHPQPGAVVGSRDELRREQRVEAHRGLDRKSTRLNSSHMSISYAVFCLKK